MARKLLVACAGVAMALGLGAATPATAATLPVTTLDYKSTSDARIYKVHRWRGRWHCRERWADRRGWHRHPRACRRDRRRWRRPGWGWRWDNRKGCWWHPRWGLRCQF